LKKDREYELANAIVSVEKVTNEMEFFIFYFGYTMKWRFNICSKMSNS